MVELHAGDEVSLGHIILQSAFHLAETPWCLTSIACNNRRGKLNNVDITNDTVALVGQMVIIILNLG